MTRTQAAVTAFVVFHVVALTLAAVPPPGAPPDSGNGQHANGLTRLVGPPLNALNTVAARVNRAAWPLVDKADTVFAPYVSAFWLAQRWVMFSDPPEVDQYVRVRYFVAPASSAAATWTATELVRPASREDQVRLLASYSGSSTDKAIEIALREFRLHRDPESLRSDVTPAELPDDLTSMARFFARRFANRYLTVDERVVRVEVWAGSAPNPDPGADAVVATPAARLAILREYYAGPVVVRGPRPRVSPYYAVEREGDITWILEYYEHGDEPR